MKMNQFKTALVIMLFVPLFSLGQSSPMDKLFDKYAGKDGFTSVNISSEMFKLAAGMSAAGDSVKTKELNEIVSQLTGMKILVYTPGEATGTKVDFLKEIEKNMPLKDYSELMTVMEKESKVRFLTKSGSNNKITEMLMIANDGKETVLMSFTGLIDLETIGKLSKSMNMKGMDSLEALDKKK
ncbi:MAG: DUF4252 domain-containing protein [Bacteroidales bacterium]|nr:DUF4252 domain-containing protein [Bacteroidales bacterium]